MAELPSPDRILVRDLARRVRDASADPVMEQRRRHWTRHNDLDECPPIIWLSPEGSWQELIPELECGDERARAVEYSLRERLYRYDHFADDSVIEARWEVPKAITQSPWGVDAQWTYSTQERGARAFKPVILAEADLDRIRMPVIGHDRTESDRRLAEAQDLLGDILEVLLVGRAHISFHLMNLYTSWRGLEEVMLDMYERPAMLHHAMSVLTRAHRGIVEQLEQQGLLELNNNDTYHSSGGKGWTDALPQADFDGKHVRPGDLWASAEAQEMALVSPAMHREFVMEYEIELLEPFARNGYGCCEDLTRKLEDVLSIPNIWRISISPWAEVEECARKLARRCIYSWKPHPSHLVGEFDEKAIKAYLRRTVEICKGYGCRLEMILKDTHTCQNHPERFDRWAQRAQEAVAEVW